MPTVIPPYTYINSFNIKLYFPIYSISKFNISISEKLNSLQKDLVLNLKLKMITLLPFQLVQSFGSSSEEGNESSY